MLEAIEVRVAKAVSYVFYVYGVMETGTANVARYLFICMCIGRGYIETGAANVAR